MTNDSNLLSSFCFPTPSPRNHRSPQNAMSPKKLAFLFLPFVSSLKRVFTDGSLHQPLKNIPSKRPRNTTTETPPQTQLLPQTKSIIMSLTTPHRNQYLERRTQRILFLDIHSNQTTTKNDSFEIMGMLTPIQPTKIFQTGRDSGLISQMNLQVPFGHDSKILKYIWRSLFLSFRTHKLYTAVLKVSS